MHKMPSYFQDLSQRLWEKLGKQDETVPSFRYLLLFLDRNYLTYGRYPEIRKVSFFHLRTRLFNNSIVVNDNMIM